jgi:DNA-binding transcriptional LysR family regulator
MRSRPESASPLYRPREDPNFADKLVTVLNDYPIQQGTVYLVYVSRKYVPLKIRTFVDFMVEAITKIPEPKPTLSL